MYASEFLFAMSENIQESHFSHCLRFSQDNFIKQVAEIISDVREPIMEVSQPVDENESRRQQVQVGNTHTKFSLCFLHLFKALIYIRLSQL